MDGASLETLVQAGAVGIAILLIGVIVFIIKIFMKHLNNHSQHLTDAINKNTETTLSSSGELKGVIKELSIYVKSLNGKK